MNQKKAKKLRWQARQVNDKPRDWYYDMRVKSSDDLKPTNGQCHLCESTHSVYKFLKKASHKGGEQ